LRLYGQRKKRLRGSYNAKKLFAPTNLLIAFLLALLAQKKSFAKEKRRDYFALCGARGGFRTLHRRKLLKKFDQNFSRILFTKTSKKV